MSCIQIPAEIERWQAEEERMCQKRDRLAEELEMHVGCLVQPAASRHPPSASAFVPPACILTVCKIFCRSNSLSQDRLLRTWQAHQRKVDEATAFALALCCQNSIPLSCSSVFLLHFLQTNRAAMAAPLRATLRHGKSVLMAIPATARGDPPLLNQRVRLFGITGLSRCRKACLTFEISWVLDCTLDLPGHTHMSCAWLSWVCEVSASPHVVVN